MTDPFQRTVDRMLDANGLMRPFRGVFLRLPAHADAFTSTTVVAMLGATVQPDPPPDKPGQPEQVTLLAHTLATRGYGIEQSQWAARELHKSHPDVDPDTMMLMPQEKLVELYGPLLGSLLTVCLRSPHEQPILYSMLFGERSSMGQVVELSCETIQMACRGKVRENPLRDTGEVAVKDFTQWQVRERKDVDRRLAEYEYHRVTGERLNLVVAVPTTEVFK